MKMPKVPKVQTIRLTPKIVRPRLLLRTSLYQSLEKQANSASLLKELKKACTDIHKPKELITPLFHYTHFERNNERLTITEIHSLRQFHVIHTRLVADRKEKFSFRNNGQEISYKEFARERHPGRRSKRKPKPKLWLDDFFELHVHLFSVAPISITDYFRLMKAMPEVEWVDEFIEFKDRTTGEFPLVQWRRMGETVSVSLIRGSLYISYILPDLITFRTQKIY